MRIWLISRGIDYEGSEVTEILDHAPSQEEIDRVVDTETGKDIYLDSIIVKEWEVGSGPVSVFWIDAPESIDERTGRFLLENKNKAFNSGEATESEEEADEEEQPTN